MSDLSTHAERQLLIKVATGNTTAFRQLFLAYHQLLGTHVFRITRSLDLTEDIVQDVFLKIWTHREMLAGINNFRAYLFVISKNHVLNCLRKLAREQRCRREWEATVIKKISTEQHGFNEYYAILDEAIDQLPPQQQKVYLLSRHERLKYAEIADRLDLSRETVKKYLQIATVSITAYVQSNVKTGAHDGG